MPTWLMPCLWALLASGAFGAGVLLLVRGLKPRFRGSDPHCATCGYNLTGAVSEVCPECGTWRTPETTVCGERLRQPGLIVMGGLLCLFGVGPCLLTSLAVLNHVTQVSRPTAMSSVVGAKKAIASARAIYQAGDLQLGDCHPDSMMSIILLFVEDRIGSAVSRRVSDPSVRGAALAELAAANRFLTSHIMPAYDKAVGSEDPADAQALVPLIDQLDKHMDKLLQILKGY